MEIEETLVKDFRDAYDCYSKKQRISLVKLSMYLQKYFPNPYE